MAASKISADSTEPLLLLLEKDELPPPVMEA